MPREGTPSHYGAQYNRRAIRIQLSVAPKAGNPMASKLDAGLILWN